MACGCEGTKCSLEPGDERHGTPSGYTNRDCRCNACREAMREYNRAYREANREAVMERQKAYREANREAVREGQKAYCEANREALRERKKAYREANREAVRERNRAYREANREAIREHERAHYEANREAVLERKKAYREANREALREYNRAYCEANRETKREYAKAYREARPGYWKAYREANPDVLRESVARRRARRKGAFIGPAFTRQQVWDRDSGICHICGQPADPNDWHMDHVMPLARGGAHSFGNCAVSHPACNLRKGARLLDELDTTCTMSTVSH